MSPNHIQINKKSLFNTYYIFVDTADHIYERIFSKEGVGIRPLREYRRDGTPFRLLYCKIRKKDESIFRSKVEEIRNKALLLGYRGYDEICTELNFCADNLSE